MSQPTYRLPDWTYRLPDWLGGHPCRILDFPPGPDGSVWVQIEEEISPTHHHYAPVGLLRSDLIEVRPPSIDDPEPLPLHVETSNGHWFHLGDITDDVTTARIGYRTNDWGIDLVPADLRRIARAAWQRANAIEGGTPSTMDLPALPAGLEFPGDDMAERLPDGGWRAWDHILADPHGLPPSPYAPRRMGEPIACPSEEELDEFDGLVCTGDVEGWHVAVGLRAVAVWIKPNGGRS